MRAPDGQLQQIKMRISDDLRAKLEAAAAEKCWPINREINTRLESSFSKEDAFGSRENAAIFQVMGQGIRELEQRTGGHWTSDYHVWWSARAQILERIDQLMPSPENAELIARLREEEKRATQELFAAAERYNEKFSPILGSHFDRNGNFDQQIRSGTFEKHECGEEEKEIRIRYLAMYEADERLTKIHEEINKLVLPQVERQRHYDKLAHEVFHAISRKSEWPTPTKR